MFFSTKELSNSIDIKAHLANPANGSVPNLLQSSINQYILSTEYKFDFTTSNLTKFKLFSLNYISGFKHTISINSSLSDLFVENGDSTSTLSTNPEKGAILSPGLNTKPTLYGFL